MVFGDEFVPGMFPFAEALVFAILLFLLAIYIYFAFALMTIADKTRTPNSWLAWLPIAQLYLVTQVSKVPWWSMLIFLATGSMAFIGSRIAFLIQLSIVVWWSWNIAQARGRPGWWGILMLIPVVNLVVLGILAWSK